MFDTLLQVPINRHLGSARPLKAEVPGVLGPASVRTRARNSDFRESSVGMSRFEILRVRRALLYEVEHAPALTVLRGIEKDVTRPAVDVAFLDE